MAEFFTVVFKGRLSSFKGNPFKADTVFGKACAVSVGDALSRVDYLEVLLRGVTEIAERNEWSPLVDEAKKALNEPVTS